MDFDKIMNRNRFFRRLTLVSVLILIFIVIIWTWHSPPDIPSSTVTALGIVVGMLATIVGFYQWSRARDDEARQRKEDRQNAPYP